MNARDIDQFVSKPVGVILVEDEPATLDHLTRVIDSSPRMNLMGVASTVQDAYALLFMTNPAVALIDLGLPDASGIEVIEWLSKHKPETECLVITAFGDEDHVVRSLEAGASGYLLKDYSNDELIEHILEVANGGSPISPLIARQLLSKMQAARPAETNFLQAKTGQDESKKACSITDRELKVIQQVARGFTAQEISSNGNFNPHRRYTCEANIQKTACS